MSAGVFAIHARPGRNATLVLSWFLFVAGVALYFYTSAARHRENPEDRVTPTIAQMANGMREAILRPAEDDEPLPAGASWIEMVRHSMLWKDTRATGLRFLYSMALLFPAVLVGLHMGLFPYVGAFLLRFVLFFDKIIALSLLPILFIAFGIDELSKIMLIVIGVTPTILLDTFNLTRAVPGEQVVKAFTLGPSSLTDQDYAPAISSTSAWVIWLAIILIVRFRSGGTHPPVDDSSLDRRRRHIAIATLAMFALLFMPSPFVQY